MRQPSATQPFALWTMGERAFEMSATDDDVSAMERELTNALRAGAAGFTTSRGKGHATSDGKPVASRLATWAEVPALVGVVGRERHGVFQLAPERSTDPEEQVEFERRLEALALETGVPFFSVSSQRPNCLSQVSI